MQWCAGLVTIAMLGCAKPDPSPPASDAAGVGSGDVHVTATDGPAQAPFSCGSGLLIISYVQIWVDDGVRNDVGCGPNVQTSFSAVVAGPHQLSAKGYAANGNVVAGGPAVDFTVLADTDNEVTIALGPIAL